MQRRNVSRFLSQFASPWMHLRYSRNNFSFCVKKDLTDLDLTSKSKNICLVEECSCSVDPNPSVSELLVSLVPLQLIYRCKIDQFIGVWFLFQKPLKYIMLIAVRWCLLQIEKRVHLQIACLRRPPGSETARAGNPLGRRRNWKNK